MPSCVRSDVWLFRKRETHGCLIASLSLFHGQLRDGFCRRRFDFFGAHKDFLVLAVFSAICVHISWKQFCVAIAGAIQAPPAGYYYTWIWEAHARAILFREEPSELGRSSHGSVSKRSPIKVFGLISHTVKRRPCSCKWLGIWINLVLHVVMIFVISLWRFV